RMGVEIAINGVSEQSGEVSGVDIRRGEQNLVRIRPIAGVIILKSQHVRRGASARRNEYRYQGKPDYRSLHDQSGFHFISRAALATRFLRAATRWLSQFSWKIGAMAAGRRRPRSTYIGRREKPRD